MSSDDLDSGDISLSRPSTSRRTAQSSFSTTTTTTATSQSSPSTRMSPISPQSDSETPKATRHRDITSPVPQRLSRTLWSRPTVPPSGLGIKGGTMVTEPPRSISVQGSPTFTQTQNQGGLWGDVASKDDVKSSTYLSDQPESSSQVHRSRSLNVHSPRTPTAGPSNLSSSNRQDSYLTQPSDHSNLLSKPSPSSRLGWSRQPGESRPPPLLDEVTGERMARWIKEIVVCNFDLERGPVIERRAVGRRWGPGEKENVAFSSFPDTSLFAEGSILFSFKIRQIPPDPSTLSYPEPASPLPDRISDHQVGRPPINDQPFDPDLVEQLSLSRDRSEDQSDRIVRRRSISSGEKAAEYRRWDERGREWLYGFVWFQQQRDKEISRGYMQKSVVILTHLPFPALFSTVLQRIAPPFFEHGYSALEAACHSIANWPGPTPDTMLSLPILSDVINVKLPDTTEAAQVGKAFIQPSPERPIPILLASLPHSTPLRAFATFLPSLWSLWECLLLAEPVLVIAPDPKTCSEIVWWLRELLRPIPPAGDFRPYLHIHDHDFSLLVNSNKPQTGVVVGVTNPFFRDAASHWPNVISITGERLRRNHSASPAPSPRPDQPEGFISRRHRSVLKDRPLLKRLEALVAEGKHDDPDGNEALRAHFQQLTEKMLVPLNRYFQTLVPTLSPNPNPSLTSNSTAIIKPFSLPNFLTHLRTHGPNPLGFRIKGLSTKSRVEHDFYAAFCMGGCFAGWLAQRMDSLGGAVASAASGGGVGGGGGPDRSDAEGTSGQHGFAMYNASAFVTPKRPTSAAGSGSQQGHIPDVMRNIKLDTSNGSRNGTEPPFTLPVSNSTRSIADTSGSDTTRPSSEEESFQNTWRASEDSPRQSVVSGIGSGILNGKPGESYYESGRRGSEVTFPFAGKLGRGS